MAFTFEPLARKLLVLQHSEQTVANLEAVVQEEKDKAAAEALRDAASPRAIMQWAEGPCERGLTVAAVNRYLVERASALEDHAEVAS